MRNRYILLADLAAVSASAYGAFALRFDWFVLQHSRGFVPFLLAALVVKPTVFFFFGMYQRFWRYATVRDTQAMVLASTAASALLALLVSFAMLLSLVAWFSRSVLVIDWLMMTATMAGIRLSVRVVAEARQAPGRGTGERKRVLVIGAGDAGTMVVREMQRNPHLGLDAAGFLDDDPIKRGKRIYNVQVLGDTHQLVRQAEHLSIDEVVIAMPRASGATLRRITEAAQRAGLPSRTMPGMYELLDGNVSVNRLRTVEISDLLRRSQVRADTDAAHYVTGRAVVVTGGGGSIGIELCRQLAHARPASLALVGHGENSIFECMVQLRDAYPSVRLIPVIADVRDAARIQRVIADFSPDVIFHAAAHKHVPLMEQNPGEAVTNNIVGTANVLDAATAAGTERFVFISTDKAVAPSSLMGASKRFAELLVARAAVTSGKAYSAVRFGNVLGSRGSVVPLFKQQIERGGPVTVTHPEMKRFFMTIPEAVHLVLQAGGLSRGGELFVLNMGQPIRIVDLAVDLITLSGFSREEVGIVFTGVRAGEKLEEALWENTSTIQPTAHPEILKVIEPPPQIAITESLDDAVVALRRFADRDDRAAIEAVFAKWIPSFQPAYVRQALSTPS